MGVGGKGKCEGEGEGGGGGCWRGTFPGRESTNY